MALVTVHVRLGIDADTGKIDHEAPMFVWAEQSTDDRAGTYEPDNTVLDQLKPGEMGGRFLAEWDGQSWQIGKRIPDA